MLKKHSEVFKTLLFVFDLIAISVTWVLAYYLRFYSDIIPVYLSIPPFENYLMLIIPILVIWAMIFKAFNLYRPRRTSTRLGELIDIFVASSFAVLVLVAFTFFIKQFEYSRLVFVYFWLLSIVALSVSRGVFREGLRLLRKKGYNLRHVLIVGEGVLAKELIQRLGAHPELGLNIKGLVTGESERVGMKIDGNMIVGTYDRIEALVNELNVDQIFIALPFSHMLKLDSIIKGIGNHHVTIKIIPDLYHFLPFCGSVEEFEGMPILGIQDTPLYGWNSVFKRLTDLLFAIVAIVLVTPLMALIAVVIKLTSSGPVVYSQERAGLDGKVFNIYKFRTMCVDAEKDTGPVWAHEDDERRTRFGAFLRRTSLDELPQFFNVLRGEMSLVGPRPERPEFIDGFKSMVPRYMLRHKMKTGITGWAQVNGWRGNTSLEKRIEHDLYYIENWSILFDIKIMWLTIWKGLVNKHAY